VDWDKVFGIVVMGGTALIFVALYFMPLHW